MHAAVRGTERRMSRLLPGVLALACACCAASTAVAVAAPGDLDPTFSGDGRLTSDLGRGDSRAAAIVRQPADGRIVVVGRRADRYVGTGSLPDFALARLNSDGSLDESFSGDGRQTTDFSPAGDQATAVALQPDGRIVVAGSAGAPGAADFAVARYNADGSLDTSFSADGRLTIDFGEESASSGVAVAGDGAIVVVGVAGVGRDADFALARLNADGSPDTAFDGDGMLRTDVAGADRATAVALRDDGAIVVAGTADASTGFTTGTNLFAVTRYSSSGVLDGTFGGDGIQRTQVHGPTAGGPPRSRCSPTARSSSAAAARGARSSSCASTATAPSTRRSPTTGSCSCPKVAAWAWRSHPPAARSPCSEVRCSRARCSCA
jgi:uncharacterized delta-60 repeat protein